MNIFDFAMKMELQGKAFYEELSSSTMIVGFKTIFSGLAADEERHYQVFRHLKEGKAFTMTDSIMLGRAKTVFSEMMSEKDRVMGELHEDLDAYRVALKIEADSVKLYESAAKREKTAELVQLFLKIANEEKRHYNIVDNICDFVMRPKYYLAWREFSNLDEL